MCDSMTVLSMLFTVAIKCIFICICEVQKKSSSYVRTILFSFLYLRSKNSNSSIFPHHGLCCVIWHANLPCSGLICPVLLSWMLLPIIVITLKVYFLPLTFHCLLFSVYEFHFFLFHMLSFVLSLSLPYSHSNRPSFWQKYLYLTLSALMAPISIDTWPNGWLFRTGKVEHFLQAAGGRRVGH